MKKTITVAVLCVFMALGLGGCNTKTKGALLGAGVGATVGGLAGGGTGAVVGGLVGAGGGALLSK
ncbi:MAG: hypothetical protein NTU49_08420 [Gammaproteobacteria bacterium]|nr:hypothetical protein [Gammaproteobacteria bacterium]